MSEAAAAAADESPFILVQADRPSGASAAKEHDHNTGRRDVYIYVNVFAISDIHTASEVFQANFYLRATWVEPGLAPGTQLGPDNWHPRLMFMNAVSTPEVEDQHFKEVNWRKSRTGDAVLNWTGKFRGTFRERFELESFPFDVQPLTIIVTSQHPGTRFFEDRFNDVKSLLRLEYVMLPEFFLSGPLVVPREQLALGKYSVLDIQFYAQRRYKYYAWNIYFPLFLLTLMLFSAFAVDVSEAGDRLGLTLTVVLASVAYKYVISQDLPHINYLTLCDIYVLGNFIFTAIIVCQNMLGGWMASGENEDEEWAKTFDRWCLRVLLGVYLGANAVYWLVVLCKKRAEWRKVPPPWGPASK